MIIGYLNRGNHISVLLTKSRGRHLWQSNMLMAALHASSEARAVETARTTNVGKRVLGVR